jgi:outer membrane lipoprotein SlyB
VMEKGEKLSMTTETIDSLAASTKGKDTKIIAGAAAGGLIIGAIKDGGKGAAIGTVIGAAAGTGAVLIMKGDEVEMPRGARLTLVVTK